MRVCVCVCSSQGSGDWEAQVFVYTHTTISGHSRVPLPSQAERSEQATGLCVQKLLTVLTLVQVSGCRCTNTAKQAADRYGHYESPQGQRHKTKPVSLMGLLTQCRKLYKLRVKVSDRKLGFHSIVVFAFVSFIHSFLLLYLLLTKGHNMGSAEETISNLGVTQTGDGKNKAEMFFLTAALLIF